MVKVEDLGMNLLYFQNSKTWDYGTYKILDSDIQNYQARKEDGTLEVSVLERILYSHSNKALNQIKKDIDTKDILNIFTWSDLANSRFIEALPLIMEAQLSGMITDGNKEIKKGSSYSGAGVDASIDASGFMLSHDRIYKAAEDIWFNYQLDKYEIEEGEDEHGNTTYSLIDNAEGTVVILPTEIKLTVQQEQKIIDEAVRKLNALPHISDSKFDLVNQNGKDVIQPKDGRDLVMLDPSGVPIVPSSPHSPLTHAQGDSKFMATTEIARIYAPKQFVNDEITKVNKNAEIQTIEHSIATWNNLLQAKQPELTDPQKSVINAHPFTTQYMDYLNNLISGGTFLGDVPVDSVLSGQQVIDAINAKFPSVNAGDHAEVITISGNVMQYTTYTASFIAGTGGSVTWTGGVPKDVHLKSGAVDAYTKAEMDAKLGAKQNTITNTYRLMSETATPDGVHIKKYQGYHSESSFSGGAFIGIAKDDYSVMGAFKFINDIANIRYRDKGGAMTDLPIHDIYNAVNKIKARAAVLDANAFTDAYKDKVDASISKTEADKHYEPLTTFFTPSTTHQAGFIIADETGIENVAIGTQVRLDLKGIDDMITNPANIPAATDKMFIGINGAIRILNSAGSASLKWETKTNATDINVKDNYKTKYFVLKKVSATEYDFVRLEDKPQAPSGGGGGGHWEIAPHSLPHEPILVRITHSAGVMAGWTTYAHGGHFLTGMTFVRSSDDFITKIAWSNRDTKITEIKYYATNDIEITHNHSTVEKIEIWKEA